MDEPKKTSITKYVTVKDDQEEALEKTYERGYPIEFYEREGELLKIFIDYGARAFSVFIKQFSICLFIAIVFYFFLSGGFGGMINLIIFMVILVPSIFLTWYHLKNYTVEFIFDKSQDLIIRKAKYFGITVVKEFKLSDILDIACYYVRKKGPYTIYIRPELSTFRRIKIYQVHKIPKLEDYTKVLKEFLSLPVKLLEEPPLSD